MKFGTWTTSWMILLALAGTGVLPLSAENPQDAKDADASGMIDLNLPEMLNVKALIDYVGKRKGINFIYEEPIVNKTISIKTPRKIPADSLMVLLESILKMKGLAMTPTDVPGLMHIVQTNQLTSVSVGPTQGDARQAVRPTQAVSRIFVLQHTTAQRIDAVVKPFLSAPTANLMALEEHGMVIVTDYAGNMARLEEVIAMVDRPARDVLLRFLEIKHLESADLAQNVTKLLQGKRKAQGVFVKPGMEDVSVLAEERTNQIVVIGAEDDVAETIALIRSLDVPLGLETKLYTFRSTSPERADELTQSLIGELATKKFYKSTADNESNLLIVSATPEIHEKIESLQTMLEKPVEESQSPIRFYKLENAKAVDVLSTLRNIEGEGGLENVSIDGIAVDIESAQAKPVIEGPTEREVNRAAGTADNGTLSRGGAVKLDDARIMADEATNTIIVIATPGQHHLYQKLIERLDVRRPQVLVKATIVTLDTTDDFELGVEISSSESVNDGEGRVLNFSSFGLSTVEASTGRLALKPGVGFNGALISADIADIIIRALQSDKRVKVISRPSVLINDNAIGELISENEEPFSRDVSTTTSSATTFGGYSAAGTKIKVTPQISEGEHLKLEYTITLSSFGEDASEDLPPSRTTNSLASEATIPDGHTIIVGGLSREDQDETIDRIPFFGEIPGLEYLFSNRTDKKKRTTLFVFLHAEILRSDQFEDLKLLSGDAARDADLAGEYPLSDPVEIR